MRPIRWILAVLAALACTGPANAQLIGGPGAGLGGLTAPLPGGPLNQDLQRLPRSRIPDAERATSKALDETASALADVRRLAARRLIREHADVVDVDDRGRPVRRGEVLALAPSPESLSAAARGGFRVASRISAPDLGMEAVVLAAPAGLSTRQAVRRLRKADPQGQYDFDHLYQESGAVPGESPPPSGKGALRGVRVGLVDGSVAAEHPALRGVALTQRAFGPGGAKVSAHATAAASLLAGADGTFHGAAPGAAILVADVYGPTPAGGSAAAIAAGLAWLARSKVGVVSISLVGPPNLLLAAAVRGLVAQGFLVVAAVGNDGPAAPPLYPAAYPGVVAVTAVDSRRRLLPEAGRSPQLAFAAPGAQMAAASPGGGFAAVRGTSFATPIVAGLLAQDLATPDRAGAAAAVRKLAARAQDLGRPGKDPDFGYGLVGFDVRTDPARVGVRAAALRGP